MLQILKQSEIEDVVPVQIKVKRDCSQQSRFFISASSPASLKWRNDFLKGNQQEDTNDSDQ